MLSLCHSSPGKRWEQVVEHFLLPAVPQIWQAPVSIHTDLARICPMMYTLFRIAHRQILNMLKIFSELAVSICTQMSP